MVKSKEKWSIFLKIWITVAIVTKFKKNTWTIAIATNHHLHNFFVAVSITTWFHRYCDAPSVHVSTKHHCWCSKFVGSFITTFCIGIAIAVVFVATFWYFGRHCFGIIVSIVTNCGGSSLNICRNRNH